MQNITTIYQILSKILMLTTVQKIHQWYISNSEPSAHNISTSCYTSLLAAALTVDMMANVQDWSAFYCVGYSHVHLWPEIINNTRHSTSVCHLLIYLVSMN